MYTEAVSEDVCHLDRRECCFVSSTHYRRNTKWQVNKININK